MVETGSLYTEEIISCAVTEIIIICIILMVPFFDITLMRINDVLGNSDVLPMAWVIFLSQIMDFGVHFHCLLKNNPKKFPPAADCGP